MVLSTTEFKPTLSITGVQSLVFHLEKGIEYARFTCVMHPTLPNSRLLASPSSQTDLYSSASSLQTFDISSTQCSQRGSPSVLELDGGGRRSAVPSGLFQKLPCAPRPKTVSPAVPGSPPRNEIASPTTLYEGL